MQVNIKKQLYLYITPDYITF